MESTVRPEDKMPLASPVSSSAGANLRSEYEDLKRSLLPKFAVLVMPLFVFWHLYTFFVFGSFGPHDIPGPLIMLAAYLALRLHRRYPRAACWCLILGLTIGYRLMLAHSLPQLAFSVGCLATIAADALLGHRQGLLAGSAIALIGFTSVWRPPTPNAVSWQPYAPLFATYLILATMRIVAHPLETTIEWALRGWEQATLALREARERRAELHRVIRALEEATYRVERMNNDLIVARREAEEARALKSRFTAIVSHELRGPLNLVLGYSKLMALSPESYGEPLPRAYRADMYTVYRTSEHLATLVDDVLDLSQVEARKLPLIRVNADVGNDIITPVIEMVRALVERKGLCLKVQLTEHLPALIVDVVRLRQVLMNLLTNAIRATEQGCITVSAALTEDGIRISVTDTGPGISLQEQARLFQEFSQIRRQERTAGSGSGLGLAISKHLVELHGGRIWVESEQQRGTAVHFVVPLPGSAPLEQLERPLEHRLPHGPKPVCLIVHDDASIVRLLARHMDRYQIVGVPDIGDLPHLVADMAPRAVLTSTRWLAATEVQMSVLTTDVPVVSCSLPHVVGEHSEENLAGYLIKPVQQESLHDLVRGLARQGETHVLLVDDEPEATRLLERMLLTLPHRFVVSRASDGQSALDRMRSNPPDIVFLDLLMPEMDGWEVLAQMQSAPSLQGIPVILVTAGDWAEGHLTMRTPLCISRRRPVGLMQAVTHIQALLALMDAEPTMPEEGH